jgi:sec-independent protein translocase protein TatA
MPGIGELVIILVIILIVFGAGKLPQIGDALGRSIRNFKRASSGKEEVEVGPKAKEIEAKEEKAALEEGKAKATEDEELRVKAAQKEK